LTRKPTSIYVDRDVYDRLKELVAPKPISQELNELMTKRVAELEGEEYDPLESADYEAVKREHATLIREAEKLAKPLKKRKTFEQLLDLAIECGIDQQWLSNLAEVAPRMLQKGDVPKEDIHQFITLMEVTQKRKEAEKKLDEIRTTDLSRKEKVDFSSGIP